MKNVKLEIKGIENYVDKVMNKETKEFGTEQDSKVVL